MSQPSSSLLRFSCPSCGKELVTDASYAGVNAPCPSCGAYVMAPVGNFSRETKEPRSAPLLAPKPRPMRRRGLPEEGNKIPVSNQPATTHPARTITAKPLSGAVERTRNQFVSPTVLVGQNYEEKKNVMFFWKMVMWLAVVAVVGLGLFYFLKYAD